MQDSPQCRVCVGGRWSAWLDPWAGRGAGNPWQGYRWRSLSRAACDRDGSNHQIKARARSQLSADRGVEHKGSRKCPGSLVARGVKAGVLLAGTDGQK